MSEAVMGSRLGGIDRLYQVAKDNVNRRWDLAVIGPVLYEAVLARELLRMLSTQDPTVTSDTVRNLAEGFWHRLISEPY
jgi:hypothetical protein